MKEINPREFKIQLSQSNGCLMGGTIMCLTLFLSLFFNKMMAVLALSYSAFSHFGSFIIAVFIGNLIHIPKNRVSVDTQGLLITITRAALDYPRSETLYRWSDITKFSSYNGKGGPYTVLTLATGKQLTFRDDIHDGLYHFMKKYFSEKEDK